MDYLDDGIAAAREGVDIEAAVLARTSLNSFLDVIDVQCKCEGVCTCQDGEIFVLPLRGEQKRHGVAH